MYMIYFCIGFDYFDECLILINDYYLYKEVFFLFIFGLDKYKVSVLYKVFLVLVILYK